MGNCFLDGVYSRHTLRLTNSGALRITGKLPAGGKPPCRARPQALGRGAWILPGSFRLARPGVDVHYGVSVPMRTSPRSHEANDAGQVSGLPGVYVVDGSALTHLPPKPHTLTIMANAYRIATRLGVDLARA